MTEPRDLGLKIIDIHIKKLFFLLDDHSARRPNSWEVEMILLENSELAWMKTMQEYVVMQVSGAAVYSHVSRIKIIKAHPVMLHIQQHAKLLSSPMVPDNSGLTTCNQMLKENQGNLLLFLYSRLTYRS